MIPQHIFREYDIRGMVDSELTPEFAYLLGRGFACMAREHGKNNIAIGWDCRLTSESYAHALAHGLSDEGIDSCLVGVGPTPQLYYAIYSELANEFGQPFGGGVQITGSHNPADMNGFKLLIGKQTLAGADIQTLMAHVMRADRSAVRAPGEGRIREMVVRERYIQELIKNSRPAIGPRRLKIVVDAGNGVGGLVGPEVLRGLGVEVIELFCEPDGRFPNHHPDPTVLENVKDLAARVRETKSDFGIGWDGDADRIGVVDETGQIIYGDMLVLLFAREILKGTKGAIIIGDVKCSSLLFDDVRAHGGNPVMWKTGHSLIKSKLKETNGALAGEMSGHIFFKHRYFGYDDALYASARLVEILSHHTGTLSSLLSDLPKMVSTPEIRVDCPEEIKFRVAEEAQKAFPEFKVDTTDGVRVQFDHGWGLVRASNTQPILVMRFEATTPELLKSYNQLIVERIEAVKRQLAN